MNDFQDNPQPVSTPPESEGRKPQFSIGKTLLWTAVVAGALTVVKVSETNSSLDPYYLALSLSLYTVIVCGILSLLRSPKSFDVWFPAGMNVFSLVFLGLITFDRVPRQFDDLLSRYLCPIGLQWTSLRSLLDRAERAPYQEARLFTFYSGLSFRFLVRMDGDVVFCLARHSWSPLNMPTSAFV